MSFLLTNIPMLEKLAIDLVRNRKFDYSEDSIPFYIDEIEFRIDHINEIKNLSGFALAGMLIRHRVAVCESGDKQPGGQQEHKNRKDSKCVIYMHGLGSSRLEALSIVECLPDEYCLFIFDFAGCGKSQGDSITYGVRESEDIECIIEYLVKNKGINEYVLWGRSMGAVAGLLYAIQLGQLSRQSLQGRQQLNRIKGLVLDSPFSNFKEIAKEIGLKKIKVPQFLLNLALSLIDNSLKQLLRDSKRGNKIYNPFDIKLGQQIIDTKIPTVFLYSLNDEVVPKQHSQKIIKAYRGAFTKVIMENCSHNQPRPKETIRRVFDNLGKLENRFGGGGGGGGISCGNNGNNVNNVDEDDRGRGLMRNRSVDLSEKGGRGMRRGISVESKQKERKIVSIENVLTEQSEIRRKNTAYTVHQHDGLCRTKISFRGSQNQLKNRTSASANRGNKGCSPLKIRLSDSFNTAKPKISIEKLKKSQAFKQSVNSFYCSLDYDNTILQKKLRKERTAQLGEQLHATNIFIRKMTPISEQKVK